MSLSGAVWTPHARLQVADRGVTESEVEAVLRTPGRILEVRPGRLLAQGIVESGEKTYLVRVFVDVDREPFEIVTAYRTSKLRKYEASP